ncbi:MAG: Hpt domain-containing protein [Hyphomonadaceae bacterium]|nr:Hpt domain-containing protein [Hyphomonadaceae bacterium]GIK48211.1 MAG: hypothetical protein BroJett013_09080 [Alphaproteobacteria bacterium]
MSDSSAKFIDPRSLGLRGLELRKPLFDEAALQRADAALQSMGASMVEWLDADISRLQQARAAAEAENWSTPSLETLHGAAHDIKGMGATYGFPIVTQIAASLCRLIETDAGKAVAQHDPTLVRAHVDALRAAVRDRIQDTRHPVGEALLQTLEQQVERLGVAPR